MKKKNFDLISSSKVSFSNTCIWVIQYYCLISKWVIFFGTFKGITDFAEQFSKFKKEANFANLENMTGNGYKRKALANTNSSNSKVISKVLEKSENYQKSEKSQKFRERIRARIRKYQQSRYIWARSFHYVIFLLRHIFITSYLLFLIIT